MTGQVKFYDRKTKKDPIQGQYIPDHPLKYLGDPYRIVFRSSWELILFRWLDENPSILRWASEELSIEYPDPASKHRKRRYFPDVFAEMQDLSGNIRRVIIEVKPYAETLPPERKLTKNGIPTKGYIREAIKYETNSAKWTAAEAFCTRHGLEFLIFTEHELGVK